MITNTFVDMTEEHYNALHKLCRVCGSKLAKGKTTTRYSCSTYGLDLKATFSIDIAVDNPHTHPSYFCHSCKCVIYHTKKAVKEDRYVAITKHIHSWEVHTEDSCEVCNPPPAKQGRPKKLPVGGRPPMVSIHSAIKHIKQIAPPALVNKECILDSNVHLYSDFRCGLCLNILNQPIELTTCGKYVCAKCLCDWLSNSLSCPCCPSDHMERYQDTVKRPPDIVLTALGNLKITCKLCHRKVYLRSQQDHLSSNCESCNEPELIAEILDKPKESPLSLTECKLQSSLLRRSLTTSGSSSPIPTVQVKTGGQVSILL